MQRIGAVIRLLKQSVIAVSVAMLPGMTSLSAEGASLPHRHESGAVCGAAVTNPVDTARFQGIQLETSDISQHETLFESVLKAQVVFKIDHPQVDHLRGYCYRDVLVVIRQDLKTPRPTGWVQINFLVPDVETVKTELEQALVAAQAGKVPRASARLRIKPGVPRSNCRVTRLEVSGPEGFLIGFDQVKLETCQAQEHGKEQTP
jgi:hypothetical protein